MNHEQKRSGSGIPVRTDRPFGGGGLEDVSQLFLTRPPDVSQRNPIQEAADEVLSRDAGRPTPAQPAYVLRPWPALNEHELSALLQGTSDGIEEGLVTLDTSVACKPHGHIDFLAVDRHRQLVIVDFDIVSADALVLRALRHFDWVTQQLSILGRIYAYAQINYTRPPRILLLAPSVPRSTLQATRHFAAPRLEWMRYQLLDADGVPAFLFERQTAEG